MAFTGVYKHYKQFILPTHTHTYRRTYIYAYCNKLFMKLLAFYLQVKCPECRAEHRIPYNGVQAFPTNVTLQRFLELHIEITGELPDPTSGK